MTEPEPKYKLTNLQLDAILRLNRDWVVDTDNLVVERDGFAVTTMTTRAGNMTMTVGISPTGSTHT